MAMFFEQRRKRKRKHPEEGIPPEREHAEEDLKALHYAKKIEKDPDRMKKVKELAKEKIATGKRRGRNQAMVERQDNTIPGTSRPKGTIKEKKYPQENID